MNWILLRGWSREARHWDGFAGVLAAALGGAQVHALDLPGTGTRHTERSPASVAGIAASIRAHAQARGIGPPYVFVAMSMGALAAIEWSRAQPQEVAGAVLINTSAGGLSPAWERLQPRCWPLLACAALSPAARREALVLRLTSNRPMDAQPLLRRWEAIARGSPVSPLNAARQLWAAARCRLPGEAPPPPMLLLSSRGDRLVSPRCSNALARHWNLPLVRHEWAGHDLPLDDPVWVASEIAKWWRLPA